MNVNGIGGAGYFAVYGMRSIDGSVTGDSFADEISKAAARLETEEPDSGKAMTKLRYEGDAPLAKDGSAILLPPREGA